MYLVTQQGIHDYDMRLLSRLLTGVDQQLDEFETEFQSMEEADMFGAYDWAEHVAGVGFVACQTYITATYPMTRVSKDVALGSGPVHSSSGRTVARILNAAANFWKHNPEWPLQNNDARHNAIRAAFEDLGFPADGEYPLSGILTELTGGHARFTYILPFLEQWRDSLIELPAPPANATGS
jgi:hypothetical protein